MASNRIGRINEEIQKEVASLIRNLKDPRVQDTMISVTRVEATPDLRYAKVYVSALEGLDTAKEAVKALKNAEGYIKNHVSKALHLRKTPELHFVADNSIEIGMHIDRILKNNKPLDEE